MHWYSEPHETNASCLLSSKRCLAITGCFGSQQSGCLVATRYKVLLMHEAMQSNAEEHVRARWYVSGTTSSRYHTARVMTGWGRIKDITCLQKRGTGDETG